MNDATNALGAARRKQADANNHCTREIGTMFLRMTRYGGDWALELNDETPIDDATAAAWAQATGVPDDTQWRKTAKGKVWRCEWRESGYSEPLDARGFGLGGTR